MSKHWRTSCLNIYSYPGRCCINQKDSLIINYLQFEPILVKLLLINNLAVFMQQRRYPDTDLPSFGNLAGLSWNFFNLDKMYKF